MGVAAAIVVGTAISVYGQMKQSQEQADAANRNASLSNQQADETLSRAVINEAAIRRQGLQLEGSQISTFAKAGVEMSGSPLLVLENTAAGVERDVYNSNREARFRADQLRQGANASQIQANEIQSGSYLRSAGTILTAYGQYSSQASRNSYSGSPNNNPYSVSSWDTNLNTYPNNVGVTQRTF